MDCDWYARAFLQLHKPYTYKRLEIGARAPGTDELKGEFLDQPSYIGVCRERGAVTTM